ncbi:TRAF3-interacting JNK-activating modulator-like protein [Labeo rohita]|uniref:TRAF3-interacting JNK-activating modulator-like protein n=1 Tax=Labeo rohita TaxID=84645 RepID=A0A498LL29_LABRO|nr:TRAF3-interacting JNK-activating modulator-like protein [Labeo rohita]RXN29372.1 TRAF3-interacting JNK-activating modulator-like protein [Labeo rohita]
MTPSIITLKSNVQIPKTVSTSPLNDEHDLKSDEWEVPVLNSVRLHGKMKKNRVLLEDLTQLSNTQKTLQTTSIQTESGFVTVKEADIHQLADYLEEALHREEALKKKLFNLQKSAATLLHSTELLWKTRCDEDLLKSKIKALEAQLQVCIKKVPQDGVKKVVLKMEKQREEYEQKALKAIQRAENEKAEAQSKMEYLLGVLQTVQAESERWQRLCEELKEGSSQLKKRRDECVDQMLQLQGHLERSVEQEEMLRKHAESLQQQRAELHSCISELEEENLNLREHLQELTGHNSEWWDSNTEIHEDASGLHQLLRTDNSMARQLGETEHRLRMKEKKCMELQADLEALEQECYSYQSRLTQCREELNAVTTRQKNSRIISRCDLSLIQEVRDSKGEAVSALLMSLNRFDKSHIYTHLESKRMGKKTYKEQYVYIYRKDMLQVQEQYQHPEFNDSTVFAREPFIIWIRSPTTLVKNFVLIGQHTCPKSAMKEMEALYEVFQTVRKKWKTEALQISDHYPVEVDLKANHRYLLRHEL